MIFSSIKNGDSFEKYPAAIQTNRCISLVEAANQLAGYLQHWLLVLTGRHGCSLESGDVGSLTHRIAEETERNVLF